MDKLSPTQHGALTLACQTNGVRTNSRTAFALEARGLVTVHGAVYGTGVEIRPTAAGRDYAAKAAV